MSQAHPIAFPSQRAVQLRYCDWLRLTPLATNGVVYDSWYANSIYDPYVAGGGHQPMGADQWAVFYKTYTVIGAKITVEPISSNSATGIIWGILTSADPTLPSTTTATTVQEQGLGVWTLHQCVANGAPTKLNSGFSARRLFNIDSIKDNQPTLGASFGSNPTLPAYFHIWASNLQDGGSPVATSFSITIEYAVLLSDPNYLPQS